MSVKIDQAFVDAFIKGDFGLPIAHENADYTPGSDPWVKLRTLPNDITPATLVGTNETDGVFRAILHYPAGSGAIVAKQKADEILAAFGVGAQVCYGGQCSTITNQYRQPGVVEDGWYRVVITIGYRAFIKR